MGPASSFGSAVNILQSLPFAMCIVYLAAGAAGVAQDRDSQKWKVEIAPFSVVKSPTYELAATHDPSPRMMNVSGMALPKSASHGPTSWESWRGPAS
jgi:hypothetical protein